jgi:hypothetical protein
LKFRKIISYCSNSVVQTGVKSDGKKKHPWISNHSWNCIVPL